MGSIPDQDPPRTNREYWTTIVLEERADGTWLATQTGVDIEGHGDSATEAATEYCRKVDNAGE